MTDVVSDHGATPSGVSSSSDDAADAVEHSRVLESRRERAAQRGSKPTRVVAAKVALRPRIAELWRSRELLLFLVRKEIKVKYKNSVLGFLWSMLNPALTLIVYFLVFSLVLKNGIPSFAIYLFAGLLIWNFFLTSMMGATNSVVSNGGIVKKVAFPREILALASVGSAAVFFFFQAIVMALFMLVTSHSPDWGDMWLLVPAFVAIVVFASAMAVFLSAVNVYFRDTQHLVEVLLTVWFWAVPIVYAYHTVGHGLEKLHLVWLYLADPLAPVILTFQRVLYNIPTYVPHGTTTPVQLLPAHGLSWYAGFDLAVIVASMLLLMGALVVFGRLEGNFAEEL